MLGKATLTMLASSIAMKIARAAAATASHCRVVRDIRILQSVSV
jgi:hypothetical protein